MYEKRELDTIVSEVCSRVMESGLYYTTSRLNNWTKISEESGIGVGRR